MQELARHNRNENKFKHGNKTTTRRSNARKQVKMRRKKEGALVLICH